MGLLGGYLHVGLSDNQLRHLCEPTTQPERKIKVQLQHNFYKCLYLNDKLPITFQVSRRDFPFALASRLDGGTTVSGTLVAAASVVSAATDGRADCAPGVTQRLCHIDVVAAARVLVGHRDSRWPWLLTRMRSEAVRAQAWRAAKGRQHPIWGDGTLVAAALRRRPCREPGLTDGRYRAALIFVLKFGLGDQPLAQDTQSVAVGSRSRRAAGMSSPQS